MALVGVSTFEEKLNKCVANCELNEILNFKNIIPIEERSRYLWAWPNKKVLNFLRNEFKSFNIQKVLSVGCGSGLLEWIIQQYCGVEMHGVELDQSWWSSEYSPRPFIPLKYSVECMSVNYLHTLCGTSSETENNHFALLFCYFNNGDAFRQYISCYDGNIVIIIGPGPNTSTFCDPEPFSPDFGSDQNWIQTSVREFDVDKNFISIWNRK